DHRHPVAVRVVRRHRPGHDDVRRRHPRQRRSPDPARAARAVTTYALVTGGGTGGHVYPALALADELVARGHARDSIRFVGSARGLEVTAVPAAGYHIDVLPGRGFDR